MNPTLDFDSENSIQMTPSPFLKGFTLYTKEKCGFCIKAKNVLVAQGIHEYNVIPCDEYLQTNRDLFLKQMDDFTLNPQHRTFPMIFYQCEFIGGFKELIGFLKSFPKTTDSVDWKNV